VLNRRFNCFGIDQTLLAACEDIECVLSVCMFRESSLVYVDNETSLTILASPEDVCKYKDSEHESLYL